MLNTISWINNYVLIKIQDECIKYLLSGKQCNGRKGGKILVLVIFIFEPFGW